MSVFKVKDLGYRFEFQMNNKRYASKYFEKKKDTIEAEAKLKEEVKSAARNANTTMTDITFYELLQLRLDYLKAKWPERKKYYNDNRYMGKRWIKEWKDMPWFHGIRALCRLISQQAGSSFERDPDRY